ncbi:MAG: hypothetical protein QM690_18540 [Sphingobium sp.]
MVRFADKHIRRLFAILCDVDVPEAKFLQCLGKEETAGDLIVDDHHLYSFGDTHSCAFDGWLMTGCKSRSDESLRPENIGSSWTDVKRNITNDLLRGVHGNRHAASKYRDFFKSG